MKKYLELLKKMEFLAKNNEFDEIIKLYKKKDYKDVADSDFHYKLAEIMEGANYISEAIKEYNLALRDDKSRVDVHRRLGEIYMDKGEIELAVEQFCKAIEKGYYDKAVFLKLGKIYEQREEKGSALQLYKLAYEKTNDKLFLTLSAGLQAEREEEAGQEAVKECVEVSSIVRFMNLFSGRENVYARQWVKRDGQCGYSPVYEPLSPKVVRDHFLGNVTVGVYQLRLDNTVNFIAFDIDINKRMLERGSNDPDMMELLIGMVHETACKLIKLCKENDIPIYLEDSGYKGRHCWIFLEQALDAQIAKGFAEIVVKNIEVPNGISIEIFPKQVMHTDKMLGNLIKLPLGIHRKSGRRALFINEDGSPVLDQMKFIEAIQQVSKNAIFKAGEALKATIIKEHKEEKENILEPIVMEKAEPVPPPVEIKYKVEDDPLMKYLFSNCATLAAIYDKAIREHELNHDEQIVLIYSIGCMDEGHKRVNAIFDKCLNIDEAMYQKSQQRGNPISCPKIRQRIPAITRAVNCNCNFSPESGSYPHPLLHLKKMPKGIEHETTEGWHINYVVSEYLKAQREMRELSIMLNKLELMLNKFFEDAGVDELSTPYGKLKRGISNGKIKFTLEI